MRSPAISNEALALDVAFVSTASRGAGLGRADVQVGHWPPERYISRRDWKPVRRQKLSNWTEGKEDCGGVLSLQAAASVQTIAGASVIANRGRGIGVEWRMGWGQACVSVSSTGSTPTITVYCPKAGIADSTPDPALHPQYCPPARLSGESILPPQECLKLKLPRLSRQHPKPAAVAQPPAQPPQHSSSTSLYAGRASTFHPPTERLLTRRRRSPSAITSIETAGAGFCLALDARPRKGPVYRSPLRRRSDPSNACTPLISPCSHAYPAIARPSCVELLPSASPDSTSLMTNRLPRS